MRLDELLRGQPARLVRGGGHEDITGIVEDSRQVTPGAMFVARPGMLTDGRRFIDEAVARGAAAILVCDASLVPDGIAAVVADDVARVAAGLAETWHGRPSDRLTLVGVTGTNGKTTVAHLVHQILGAGGRPCGLIGTVETYDGRTRAPSALTTPPAFQVSRLLADMIDGGCVACVMEVSSHALAQERAAGLRFDIGVFTNLTGDHMDYHGSPEAYTEAKRRLFAMLSPEGCAVINAADPSGGAMSSASTAPVVTTAVAPAQADAVVHIASRTLAGMSLVLEGPWGRIESRVPLVGAHNASNVLQAVTAAHALGLGPEQIAAGLACCTAPPGRLEPVTGPDDDFAVLVDYAHTDDALRNVLEALRPIVEEGGRLRLVFGCGGDRDRTKRPRMAAVACSLADDVVVTSDNPRTEDPRAIVDEVMAGVPAARRGAVAGIVDRAAAIGRAIETARDGDVIVIAGKGHETYQIVGREQIDFDDRIVAADAISRRRSSAAEVAS